MKWRGVIFFSGVFILFAMAALILLSPLMVNNEFLFPKRIDSTYLSFVYKEEMAKNGMSMVDAPPRPAFNPGDAGLNYRSFTMVTKDNASTNSARGVELHGWYIAAKDTPAPTIILVHDISQSKILLIEHLRQLHDRNIHVAVYDQRACGSSGGTEYHIGLVAASDLKLVTDAILNLPETYNVTILGIGTGAAIVALHQVFDNRAHNIILQQSFNSYERYVNRIYLTGNNFLKKIYYPILKRSLSKNLGQDIHQYAIENIVSEIEVPCLVIAAGKDEITTSDESLEIFNHLPSQEKELFLMKDGGHQQPEIKEGKNYFDRISEFVYTHLPRKPKSIRNKRLATL